ncbi:MAG: serine hydrolase domain-containing protein [Nitrospirota bacterium]
MAPALSDTLQQAVRDGVFPGAALLVQEGDAIRYCDATGSAALLPAPEPMRRETLFDLASLTKPLATATVALRLIALGRLALDHPVARWLPEFRGDGKERVTLYHLLNHSSGLPAWKPYYKAIDPNEAGNAAVKERLLNQIAGEPLVAPPGQRSVYSDLGFILLGTLIERVAGRPLDRLCREEIFLPLSMAATGFRPLEQPELAGRSIAATERCPWRGRVLRGDVHDEHGFALGGVSGHAGLFAPVDDVARYVGALIAAEGGRPRGPFDGVPTALLRQFLTRQPTPGSSWALGWDTPSERSSAGRFFSANSCGHLGYTGTSVWIDRDRGWGVTLLTNRVHPTRQNVKIGAFRPMIHDLVARAFFPGVPAA